MGYETWYEINDFLLYGTKQMIYKILNCQMVSVKCWRVTRVKGNFRDSGCKSIERAKWGIPLGFNKKATLSICYSLERFGLE
jgi:hypothetical protein